MKRVKLLLPEHLSIQNKWVVVEMIIELRDRE